MSGLSPMYTPQGMRGSPHQRETPIRSLAREKGKTSPATVTTVGVVTTTMTTLTAGGEEGLVLMNPLTGAPDTNGEADGVPDTDVWKRFQSEGALDISSLERKDRAALHARIAALEAEVKIATRTPSVLELMHDKVKQLGSNCQLYQFSVYEGQGQSLRVN